MANVEGQVVDVDSNGRLITDIDAAQVNEAPKDDNVSIKFGGHETVGLYDKDHGQPETTLVASLGESGCVEIEIVGMDLSGMLGISKGTKVQVVW